MYRFNRDSRIVCHCNSPEEAIAFINYCNDHFLEPEAAHNAEKMARSMFYPFRGEPNDCVRYSNGDMGFCSKGYYISEGFPIYEFYELNFPGNDDSGLIVDPASITSFLDLL